METIYCDPCAHAGQKKEAFKKMTVTSPTSGETAKTKKFNIMDRDDNGFHGIDAEPYQSFHGIDAEPYQSFHGIDAEPYQSFHGIDAEPYQSFHGIDAEPYQSFHGIDAE